MFWMLCEFLFEHVLTNIVVFCASRPPYKQYHSLEYTLIIYSCKRYFPDMLTCWISLFEPTEGCLASVWLAAVDSGSTVTADIGQAYRHSRRYLLSWLSRSWWIYRSHLTSAGCLEWKWGEPWWMDDNVRVVHVGGGCWIISRNEDLLPDVF